ncbi:MAG: phosphotransferase [Anaerolineae bacterium]|nr:phosphotransferase [Anaerolineae bacterium]
MARGGAVDRDEALRLFEAGGLDAAARAYGTRPEDMRIFEGTEGCQNLVYAYEGGGARKVLRVSFRPDRSEAQIRSELDYVAYLDAAGVRVARVVPSRRGELLERFEVRGVLFLVASFERGAGFRMPDNDYRYREGAPQEEYFGHWGTMLGRMHQVAMHYSPPAGVEPRPDLPAILDFEPIEAKVPARLPQVRAKLETLLEELRSLPRTPDGYGMIHADFNDGNFTVDPASGDLTVFDFDDCCYGWFVYELASAWESGVGWVLSRNLSDRRAFMERYFGQVLDAYRRETLLPDRWLALLPLFLRVVQMQELVYYLQYLDGPDEDIRAGLAYKIRCVVDDIPYLGFFDPIYDPRTPFRL